MTSPTENNSVDLLLEDYKKRFQRGYTKTQGSDLDLLTVLPSVQNGPELNILLEDYPERAQAWLKQNADSDCHVPPSTVETIPGESNAQLRLLLDDYDPVSRFWEQTKIRSAWLQTPTSLLKNKEADRHLNNLLISWEHTGPIGRHEAGVGSLIIHAIWIVILILQPRLFPPNPVHYQTPEITAFKIIVPTDQELAELTQTSPSQEKTTKFSGPSEEARPLLMLPDMKSAPAPSGKPDKKLLNDPKSEISSAHEPSPKPDPEPATSIAENSETSETPPLAAALSPNPGELRRGRLLGSVNRPAELPAPRAPSRRIPKPRLTLEDPKAAMPGRAGRLRLGSLKLTARTDEVIESALRRAVSGTSGRPAVGDGLPGGLKGGYIPPSPGNIGSNLELLSDPRGVDFRPYLTQILASVRRNWHAVIPESARLGISRGAVSLQFSVARDGTVPKLVIASSSSVPALDRAAVAGISASNPFPPLPADFTGEMVRLQFRFAYNMK